MVFKLTLLIILLHLSGSYTLESIHVTCENICALTETTVELKCLYSAPVKTAYWFISTQSSNWRDSNDPEDLTLDLDYSGRVKNQKFTKDFSTLTISDVRERDSGEYQLLFIMEDGVKRYASVGVKLTATDLQVIVNPVLDNKQVNLTCDTSCDLTLKPPNYFWKIDGQYIKDRHSKSIDVSKKGSYSCFLTSDFQNSSSPVCLLKSDCWDVKYSSRRVCALEGSTVEIPSSFSLPSSYKVTKTFWTYGQLRNDDDLHDNRQFTGRVVYEENKLRIKELKLNDSGEYQLRIITNKSEGKFSGSPGVLLTVTDTQVTRSSSTTSDGKVILSCSTRCTLSEKRKFVWFKNGLEVTDGFTKTNKLYLDSVSSDDLQRFSCAVREIISEENTVLQTSLIILSLVLILALLGVLFYCLYKRRKNNSPQLQEDTKKKFGSSTGNHYVCSMNSTLQAQIKDEDVHYCSVDFKKNETTVTETTLTDSVEYAAVNFR